MSRIEKKNIDRRQFLRGAGIGLVGAAGAGALAACSPSGQASSATEEADATAVGSENGASSSWRTPPEPVEEFVEEHDYDVVVVGHGYAGVCACRELAESGVRVALLERQPEDTYMATGSESMAINSKVLDRATEGNPIPHVDMNEYFENWMTITGNQVNPALLMRFVKNEADNIDWYYDGLTDEDFAHVTHTGWPDAGDEWEHLLPNIGPIRFYPGTFSCFAEECNQTKVQGYNREKAKAAGADFYFGMRGEQLVLESGAVAGVVASDSDGAHHKFSCRAAVMATGGFAYNKEMLVDLMPDIANNMVSTEEWKDAYGNPRFQSDSSQWPYQGDGVKMALWSGAHLETVVPGMNARHIQAPASMSNLPQAIWVRGDGKRFMNEFYPVVEQRGVVNVYMPREPINCVFDDDFTTYREYYVPQHGGQEPTPAALQSLRESMDKAYAKFKGTWVEPEGEEDDGMPSIFKAPDYLADDTLEGLAGQLGLTGDAVTNFIEQIERYNGYCETGVDEEFGRNKAVLFPVKKAPFYAVAGNPGLGEVMATCGGVITDADQNALNDDYEPIPGLYVSGNDCGRRFGAEYCSPTPGVSLSMAITLGRECGKSVKKYLDAN